MRDAGAEDLLVMRGEAENDRWHNSYLGKEREACSNCWPELFPCYVKSRVAIIELSRKQGTVRVQSPEFINAVVCVKRDEVSGGGKV